MSDGRVDTIKRVKKHLTPWEEDTIRRFSREPLASDPCNRAIPLYDTIRASWDDDIVFLIMPHVVRIWKHKFATVGEAVECFRQLFEVSSTPPPSVLESIPSNIRLGCAVHAS